MGTALLQLTITLATATLVINGVTTSAPEILASAKSATNSANVHQLSTALELYRLSHDSYPAAKTGEQLINTLISEGYIQNKPADPSVFQYKQTNNGTNYTLTLK